MNRQLVLGKWKKGCRRRWTENIKARRCTGAISKVNFFFSHLLISHALWDSNIIFKTGSTFWKWAITLTHTHYSITTSCTFWGSRLVDTLTEIICQEVFYVVRRIIFSSQTTKSLKILWFTQWIKVFFCSTSCFCLHLGAQLVVRTSAACRNGFINSAKHW